MDALDIARIDALHLWHPYSPTPAPIPARPVRSARGIYLTMADGSTLMDAMSSWWAVAHGHSHPALVAAARAQIEQMSHVMFGGLTHEPAVRLGEKLTNLTGLDKVFFSDSGSVSVEVAIKMALQYQRGRGAPERTKMLTWRGGYHGDTFAPMSVCDPEGGMHSLWAGTLAEQRFVSAPPALGAAAEVRAAYLQHMENAVDGKIAAIILEPVVQGAGGMRFHDPELLVGVREICDRHDVLLIADEIATGFGRTGELFATLGAGVSPDIMCVGKALTGGFMSLAATLTTSEVARVIDTPAGGGALMHGPTFMANPLACAVGVAAVGLIEDGSWRVEVPRIEAVLTDALSPLNDRVGKGVADIRVLGAIAVVEMEEPVDMAVTTDAAVARGVWIRPFGKLIYVMPPYISTNSEVQQMGDAVVAAALADLHKKGNA